MIASQDSHRERGEAPPKASTHRTGGICPEIDLPIPHNEDTRTVDEPDGSGFSEEFHNAPLTVSDEEVPLRYTQGGSYAELHLPQRARATGPSRARKRRSQVGGYSRASRLRLCRTLAKIPRDSKAIFITLTTPEGFGIDSAASKHNLLERFHKRLERRFGEHAVIWKLEFGERPEPHFHVIMFSNSSLPVSKAKLAEIREFVARAWWEICGRICEEHLRAGTRVERPRSLVRTMKYISKAESPQNCTDSEELIPQQVGRRWGVWRKELLPIEWVVLRVSLHDAFQARRILRRLLGLKNRPGVVTFRVFVRDDHIKRLLELLGYPALG